MDRERHTNLFIRNRNYVYIYILIYLYSYVNTTVSIRKLSLMLLNNIFLVTRMYHWNSNYTPLIKSVSVPFQDSTLVTVGLYVYYLCHNSVSYSSINHFLTPLSTVMCYVKNLCHLCHN